MWPLLQHTTTHDPVPSLKKGKRKKESTKEKEENTKEGVAVARVTLWWTTTGGRGGGPGWACSLRWGAHVGRPLVSCCSPAH